MVATDSSSFGGAVRLAHAHAAQPEGGDGQALRAKRARRQHARTIGRVELSHHPSVVPPTSTPGCSMRARVPRLALGLALTLWASLAAGQAPAPAAGGPAVDTALLQRLLVAEDARGTGAEGLDPLLTALAGGDTLLRRLAVRGLGRFQRPELGRRLLPSLADPVPAVRAEAANAVAQSAPAVAPQRGRHRRRGARHARGRGDSRPRARDGAGPPCRGRPGAVAGAAAAARLGGGARRGGRHSRAVRDPADARPRARALHSRAGAPGHGHAHARERGPAPARGARVGGHGRPAAVAAHARGGGRARQRHGGARRPRSRRRDAPNGAPGHGRADGAAPRGARPPAPCAIRARSSARRRSRRRASARGRRTARRSWSSRATASRTSPSRRSTRSGAGAPTRGGRGGRVAAARRRAGRRAGPPDHRWQTGAHALLALARLDTAAARPLLPAMAGAERVETRIYAARAAAVVAGSRAAAPPRGRRRPERAGGRHRRARRHGGARGGQRVHPGAGLERIPGGARRGDGARQHHRTPAPSRPCSTRSSA